MGFPNVAQVIRDPASIVEEFIPFQVLLNDIKLDVLSSERASYDFDVTTKPVEKGLPVTDSRIAKPVVIAIEGLQSDDVFATNVSDVQSLLNGIQSWQDKKDQLLELKDQQQVIELKTPMGVYQNMLITSFNHDRTPQNAYRNGFIFRMNLMQVRFVSSEITTIDKSQLPANLVKKESPENEQANKRNNKKKKKNKKTPVDPTEKKKSIAAGIFDAAKKALGG